MASISNAIKMVVSGDASSAMKELAAIGDSVKKFATDSKSAGNEGVKSFKLLREGIAGVGIITAIKQMRALADEIENMPGIPDHVRDGMASFARGFDSLTITAKGWSATLISELGKVGESIRGLFDSEFYNDKARMAAQERRAKQIESDHKRAMERIKEEQQLAKEYEKEMAAIIKKREEGCRMGKAG
jgi:hypothetical protein